MATRWIGAIQPGGRWIGATPGAAAPSCSLSFAGIAGAAGAWSLSPASPPASALALAGPAPASAALSLAPAAPGASSLIVAAAAPATDALAVSAASPASSAAALAGGGPASGSFGVAPAAAGSVVLAMAGVAGAPGAFGASAASPPSSASALAATAPAVVSFGATTGDPGPAGVALSAAAPAGGAFGASDSPPPGSSVAIAGAAGAGRGVFALGFSVDAGPPPCWPFLLPFLAARRRRAGATPSAPDFLAALVAYLRGRPEIAAAGAFGVGFGAGGFGRGGMATPLKLWEGEGPPQVDYPILLIGEYCEETPGESLDDEQVELVISILQGDLDALRKLSRLVKNTVDSIADNPDSTRVGVLKWAGGRETGVIRRPSKPYRVPGTRNGLYIWREDIEYEFWITPEQ